MRICPKCSQSKSIEEFNHSYCQLCYKAYIKAWKLTNKDKVDSYRNSAQRKIIERTMNILRNGLRTKGTGKLHLDTKFIAIFKCNPIVFKAYIASLWVDGMTWDNYGTGKNNWQIDHIKPCASFDVTESNQFAICFHPTNLRPLWTIDNLKKGSKSI